jgi:hypothetical protein
MAAQGVEKKTRGWEKKTSNDAGPHLDKAHAPKPTEIQTNLLLRLKKITKHKEQKFYRLPE